MRIVALTCPSWSAPLPAELAPHPVSERPGRDQLAPLLTPLLTEVGRVVLAGTDADLAAVVLRLLRTERLGDVEVAYLPTSPDSAAADVWALPTDPASAIALAMHGAAEPVPLVRDDSGGVLLGRGELRRVRGEAYCDADLVLRGQASRVTVMPLAPVGVQVRVTGIGLTRRTRAASGRAVQVGCLAADVVSDGVPHPRPVTRWTWYKHTEPLHLVRSNPN
jgi:hypothetical protein